MKSSFEKSIFVTAQASISELRARHLGFNYWGSLNMDEFGQDIDEATEGREFLIMRNPELEKLEEYIDEEGGVVSKVILVEINQEKDFLFYCGEEEVVVNSSKLIAILKNELDEDKRQQKLDLKNE